MNINKILLGAIEHVLGPGRQSSKGNYAFICPKCNKKDKRKLEINLDESSPHYQSFGCWVCGDALKGKKLINLFKTLGVEPAGIRPLLKHKSSDLVVNIQEEDKIILPEDCISLIDANEANLTVKKALVYLRKRGIGKEEIIKYNLGYCDYGPYANRIIIPSYDERGLLNYFTARSFDINNSLKYKNPSVIRDIIPFELFINWSLPIILCEGPMDALAIKRNCIPLLGKNISSALMKKIVSSPPNKIYIALDNDALKQAIKYCEQFMEQGKRVFLIELNGSKDASEIGFEAFTKHIHSAKALTFSGLLEKKMQLQA